MYTEHFGLNEKPFSISPDPRYLYLSPRHADALAHLLYGVSESGGFIQLTGEVGTGKTTLVRSLLEQLPENSEIALILNPQLSSKQFLQGICHELGVPFIQRDTAKTLIDRLNERLLSTHAQNRRVVLIVDEAQTMSPDLLEQVRLLTNLETNRRKLLQIILIGQPELRATLAQTSMRQIAQRITGRYHLEPLTVADTSVYVTHRLRVAGGRPDLFSDRAIRKLFRLSRGIPRLINVIADRALLAAYSRDEFEISAGLVRRAADEVFGRTGLLRLRSSALPWADGASNGSGRR
jgi:general secretion pathway protein A